MCEATSLKHKLSLHILMSCTLMHWLAIYGSRPYISLLAAQTGGGNVWPGIVAGIYSLVQVALALQVSEGIDRFGARRVIIFGNVFLILSFAGLIFARNLLLIAICSFSLGFSHVLVMIAAQYLATGYSGAISKERAVGLYTFGNSAGIFIGPSLGAFFHEYLGLNNGFGGTLCIAVLSMALACFIDDNDKDRNVPQISALSLMSDKKVLGVLLVSSMVTFTSEIAVTYFPIYGQECGLTVSQIGLVLSTSGFAMMFVRPFIGRLTKFIAPRNLVFASLLIGGGAMMLYGIVTAYALLLLVAAVCGLMQGILGPLTIILVTNAADKIYRGKVLALRTMIIFFSQSVSPVLCGLLSVYTGIAPVFIFGGSVMGLCSIFAYKNE